MRNALKNKILTLMTLGVVLLVSACESMDRTEKGALIGGVSGAGIGGIVGHQRGKPAEGALIGAALGTIAGGLVGHQMDKRQQDVNPDHMTIVQIAKMGDEGVPSSVIIEELKRTRSVYSLDSETIQYLKNHDIKDNVIDYMLSTSG